MVWTCDAIRRHYVGRRAVGMKVEAREEEERKA